MEMLTILQLFLVNPPSPFRVNLVHADSYSANPFLNGTSIIGLVHRGDAHLSPPIMSLTKRRFQLVSSFRNPLCDEG